MEQLLLARVDDRLIHGQVMTAWMKLLPAKEILIADDKVAKDPFMTQVLTMAAPAGVKVKVYSVEEAAKALKDGLKVPSIMLAKTPLTYEKIVDLGAHIPAINIGGMANERLCIKISQPTLRNGMRSENFWIRESR